MMRNTASPRGLPSCRETVLSLASRFGRAMYRDTLFDELRQVERDVAEGERQLAELEALRVEMKKKNQDTSRASAHLLLMREVQGCSRCCSLRVRQAKGSMRSARWCP